MEKKEIGIPRVIKEQRLKERIERLKLKAKIKKEPKLSDLKKIVQRKVNTYVRERDKDLPCISCGKWSDNWHCGHYIAQGSSGALRYNLDNLNKQCAACNLFKHGALIDYRISLVRKIGAENVEWLETHRHDIKKWTKEELLDIIKSLSIL